ncbi:MAG: cobalamin-binding protein [Pseudomonadota bacterium]
MTSIAKKLGIISILTVLSACNDGLNHDQSDQARLDGLEVSVTDFTGQLVSLAKPAERVIALAPSAVENLYTAGAGDKLVGVMSFSDYPPEVKTLPIIGSFDKLNVERIIALNPDLIIAWQTGNSQAAVDQLLELGFPVYMDQPKSLEDVAKSIRDFGMLTGQEKFADESATKYLDSLKDISSANADKEKVSVFYQVWHSPLQTISGDHVINHAIEICGGNNIYADEFAIAPIVGIESILDRNPRVILGSNSRDLDLDSWQLEWRQWQSIDAVQHNHLFTINPDHIQRHTTRLILGIESICTSLDLARSITKE